MMLRPNGSLVLKVLVLVPMVDWFNPLFVFFVCFLKGLLSFKYLKSDIQ